jgi:hypothetical protein
MIPDFILNKNLNQVIVLIYRLLILIFLNYFYNKFVYNQDLFLFLNNCIR